MTRIFISYSSEERAEAISVKSWLERNGWENDVFIDVDPEHGLTGGEAWRAALRDAAGRCEAVILLLSRAWLASKPCWNEFLLAEKYGKPCIPMRVDDGVSMRDLPREITNNYQVIEKVASTPAEFEMRLKRALEAAGAGPENFTLPKGRRPYPGLQALTEQDAALLFGRDADVLASLDTLREIRSTGRKRLFVLLGASGAGKSSLMRAGIWPRLNRDDRNFIALPTVRPSNAILSGKEGLWQALETALTDQRRARHLADTTPRTRTAIRLAAVRDTNALALLFEEMKRAAQRSFMDATAAPPSIVLAIDQGEELYSPEGLVETEMFLRLLGPVWQGDPQFIGLLAIRSDVYPQLQADCRIDQLQVRPVNLAPMPSAGLLQVIEGPAHRIGLDIDPTLTAALLHDSEGADALPLLAFTLERLYDERLQDKRLTLADYTRMGGVKGAIEVAAQKARAEAEAAGLPARELDALLRRTFLPHLARVNEAGEFARRVADLSELDHDCLPLVRVLVAQRLLVADQKGDAQTVEIAHEAILREWPLLRGWLDAERGFLEWRDQIGRARKLHEREEGDLLTGRALVVAQGFLEARHDAVREPDREFIKASIAAEQRRLEAEEAAREARRQAELNAAKIREEAALTAAAAERRVADAARRTSSKMRRIAVVMTLLAAVAAGAGYLAYVNGQTAETQAKLATAAAEQEKSARAAANWSRLESESRRLALVGEAVRAESGDDKAMALAWLALPHDAAMQNRPITNEAASAAYSRHAHLIGHLKQARFTTFAPSGDLAVTVLHDARAELWDTRTREVLHTFQNVNVRPLRLDESEEEKNLVRYDGFAEYSLPIYFLDGGNGLLMAHQDDVIRYYDLTSFSAKQELPLKRLQIDEVVFSPDGSHLLGMKRDGSSVIWRFPGQKQILNIRKPELIKGFFSSNNKFLFGYSTADAGTAWNLEQGRELFAIPEPKDKTGRDHYNTGEVHFSERTDRLLTTTSARNRVGRLWDLKTGRSLGQLDADEGWGFGDQFEFKFIDGGTQIVVGAALPEVGWVWNATTGQRVRKVEGYANVFNQAGRDKILKVIDGRAVLTTLDDREEFRFGRGFNINQISDMQIKFETNSAIAGGRSHEGPLELWDIKTGALRTSLGRVSPDGKGRGFLFNSDGTRILTENDDGTARLWNAATGAMLATLSHEEKNMLVEEARLSPGDGTILIDFKVGSDERMNKEVEDTLVWRLNGTWKLQANAPVRNAIFSPDGGRVLITAEDNSARIWLAKRKVLLTELKGHTGTVVDAAFSEDGRAVITGGWDKTARLWDAATGALKATLEGHASGIARVAFSPGGRLALTASHDGTAKTWNPQTGGLRATLAGHKGSVVAASFSPDGKRILTASSDETAALWDAETGVRIASLIGHTGALFSARFSANGARVLTSSEDHTAKIWDGATGALLTTLDAHSGMVADAQWSPDGASILTVSADKTGILWDATTYRLRAILKAHLGPITRAAFSPDGKQVATISEDRTLRLWDAETGALLATHSGHEKTIHALAFSPDNRTAVTTSTDGTARFWNIFPGTLKERVGELGRIVAELRPLTKDECELYGVANLPGTEIACRTE